MPSMDIFNSDAFSLQTLTHAVNLPDYKPGLIEMIGGFGERSVTTTSISVERLGDTLSLVPVTSRGAPGTSNSHDKRSIYQINANRLSLEDAVYADEVQNIRAFGSETEAQSLQSVVTQRLMSMANKIQTTIEFQCLGAIRNVVLDADGLTTLANYATIFGVTPNTAIDFLLETGTENPREKCNQVIRTIRNGLGGVPFNSVVAVVGEAFWDTLTTHDEVKDFYTGFQDARDLRNLATSIGTPFTFGGIQWYEYRGSVSGVDFVDTDEAHFFPTGVPDMFTKVFAPADREETVNTPGLPLYAFQDPDSSGKNRKRELEVQSNVIALNTRPLGVVTGNRTS